VGREITFRVFESYDEAGTFSAAWDDLVIRTGTDIYQTYDWCRIWWRHYGQGRRLQLLLGFSDDRLVGVMPIFTEILWLVAARIRVAKLVGSDFSLQSCNLAIEDIYLPAFVAEAIERLFGECSCDLLLLGPLSGRTAMIDEILTVALPLVDFIQETESIGSGCATRFELPSDFSSYLNGIGSRQRGNYKRAMKQWAERSHIKADIVRAANEIRDEFGRFAVLHEEQWKQAGKLGHFGDWPAAMEFNRDLVECFSVQDKVRFYRIQADDTVATSQYCFVHNRTNYWRLPARAGIHDGERLGLGRLGLVKMIEDSIADGISIIEGGRGHYDYKVQLGATEWPLRTVQIMRSGTTVWLRVKLFRMFARLLNLAYYKVFFLRITPRFRWLNRPLWATWIRSTW
jgi:CelD/BcsL family acetyltransferase involved in cellulose biosynthesis